jgi:hypothetical protein
VRYFRVNRRDIAYFRFTLEAYEGLATLSTLDARNGIVVLSIPESFAEDADLFLKALAEEIDITEIGPPGDPSCIERQENNNDA